MTPIPDMTNHERKLHIRRTRDHIGAFNFFAEREEEREYANSSRKAYRDYIKEDAKTTGQGF